MAIVNVERVMRTAVDISRHGSRSEIRRCAMSVENGLGVDTLKST